MGLRVRVRLPAGGGAGWLQYKEVVAIRSAGIFPAVLGSQIGIPKSKVEVTRTTVKALCIYVPAAAQNSDCDCRYLAGRRRGGPVRQGLS
jgi:hypothetical protein